MLIIKEKEEFVDFEFEVDKTYKTKFQTGELFTIKEIRTRPFLATTKVIGFYDIYESHPHLGLCPLDPERLIPDKQRIIVEDDTPLYSEKQMYNAVKMVFDSFNDEQFNEMKMKEEHGIWKGCVIFNWFQRMVSSGKLK